MLSVLIWWLVIQAIGLVTLPIALKLLRFLPDRGFGFARQVGLLLTGYLFWILVSLGILQNTLANIIFCLLLVGGLSALVWAREGKEMLSALRERRRIVVVTEVLFLVSLAGFALFRAYNPDIAGTEKPMEFGFLNAILRSRTFPPRDPWLSGYAISYYYFGYVIMAMLTRLSGLPSDVTFNLTGCTLFALTVAGAFSLVYNMVQAYLEGHGQAKRAPRDIVSWIGIGTGLLGSVLVALMGNLEGLFELIRARGAGSVAFWRWLDVRNLGPASPSATWYPQDHGWWWRASRVIHDLDAKGNSMEVIDEFPFFSFLLGDNHPHVLALPFVLLALALTLNLMLSMSGRVGRNSSPGNEAGGIVGGWVRGLQGLWQPGSFDVVMWALLLGGLGFLNTWDYPIYLGIFVVAYGAGLYRQHGRLDGRWVSDLVTLAGILLVLGVVLYLPFYLGFRSQAGGIGLVGSIKTRLHQFLLMLGVFIYLVTGLLVALVARYRGFPAEGRKLPLLSRYIGGAILLLAVMALAQRWWTAALVLGMAGVAFTLLVWGAQASLEGGECGTMRLESSSLFALLLIIAGLALVGSVEFVFLRDSFNTRMNTVFKFYYQAWVLLGVASAYGVFCVGRRLRTARGLGRLGLAVWALAGTALVGAGMTYTLAAPISKAGGFGVERSGMPTLDGTRYVERFRNDDYQAVQWLRANAPAEAILLEAPGGSYTEYNWVSAHTGIPTVLGWDGHELQWRGDYVEAGKREPDISAIYQGLDPEHTLVLLERYDVNYVYVGRREREKYHLNTAMVRKFDQILRRVYEEEEVIVFERPG